MKRSTPKLEIHTNPRGRKRYWCRLVNGSGEVMMKSDPFVREYDARRQAVRCMVLMRAPTLTLID